MKTVMMNTTKVISLFLLLLITNLESHAPLIDYSKINQWCAHADVAREELKVMELYLQLVKKIAESSIEDPNWINSSAGKEIEKEVNNEIDAIMRNQSLTLLFHEFTALVKEELNQSKVEASLKNRNKYYYTILALVVSGCLDCVQKKIEN